MSAVEKEINAAPVDHLTGLRAVKGKEGRSLKGVRRHAESLASLAAVLNAAADALDWLPAPVWEEGVDFFDEVRRFEIFLITNALRRTAGSQIQAAALLKMKATTLNTKIKSYDIDCHGSNNQEWDL